MSHVTPPLIDAAWIGNAADVASLIADGADVNENSPVLAGATALIIACGKGHLDVVTLLLAANADVDNSTAGGATPLNIASETNHPEIVTALLAANANVNMADDEGVTPLYMASQQGHTEIVEKLLAANASVDTPIDEGVTPLYIACEEGHTEVAKKLLAANATVNKAVNDGRTPMVIACVFGRLDIVQLLSSYGASRTFAFAAPNDTAEHTATNEGHHELAAWLVRSRHWPAIGPWSRQTNNLYPPELRARVAELMRMGQLLKVSDRFVIEVWETYVVKHVLAMEMWH